MLDVEALVYFKGNLIHVFLIHFHLTHQNVALEKLFEFLVSYIFFSPNFSLFMTYFPDSRNPILPKAKSHSFEFGSKMKKGNEDRTSHSLPLRLDMWRPAHDLGVVPASPAQCPVRGPQGKLAVALSGVVILFQNSSLNKCVCQPLLMRSCLT